MRRSSRPALIAALLLVIAVLITAPRVPLLDPDEGYYPATAAESVDAGTWWDLRFNGDARWEKPILAYALIEGSFAILGRGATAARLPSAIEGLALVLIVAVLAGRLAGRRAGWLSAVVLATTLGVQVFARAAHPEIAVVLSIGTTELLLAWWLIVPGRERPRMLPILIGFSMGYGLLAKGPVAVVVPALSAALAAPLVTTLRGRWREGVADGLMAGAVAVAVAAPWYIAMTLRHGVTFLENAVWTQNFGRYTGQMAEHGVSAGSFVLAAAIAVLPWTAFLPAAFRPAFRRPVTPRDGLRTLAAMASIASLAFYALSASKLASYSLALAPPLSVLVGLFLDDVLAGRRRGSGAFIATAITLAALGLILAAVPLLHGNLFSLRDLVGGVPAAQEDAALWRLIAPASGVLLLGAAGLSIKRLPVRVAVLCGVGAALPLSLLLSAAPLLSEAYPWQRFGGHIATDAAPAWVQTYRAPSLTFYAGRPVVRAASEADLQEIIRTTQSGWVVVGADWDTREPLATRLASGSAVIVDRMTRLMLVRLR